MSRDLNKVQCTGRLGADPVMKYTAQGSAVTTFRVASNRAWKDSSGTARDDTEWFRIVAWDKLGEICNEYLAKGTRVYIEGRLQTRKWTDSNGQERYAVEVIASDMIILSGRRDDSPESPDSDALFDDPPSPQRHNQPQSRSASGPTRGRNQPQPVEDDDEVPF